MPDLDGPAWVGLASSVLLFATLSGQVFRQYRDVCVKGVPRIFFLGQVLSSAGFIVYSAAIDSTLFVAANVFILASGVAGYAVTLHNRRRQQRHFCDRPPATSRGASTAWNTRYGGGRPRALQETGPGR
jgi:MtN3 and saliva related transmembrane protein